MSLFPDITPLVLEVKETTRQIKIMNDLLKQNNQFLTQIREILLNKNESSSNSFN